MSNIVPYADIEKMATAVAASKLFGVKNPQEAIALMLVAQAEGMHPATAARDYHVIQGRPALKADAMLARFQAAGGKVEWKDYTDEKVTGVFSHPQGGQLELTWTMQQAKSIGIAGKDNWRNYPRAMLRARCISEGIRSVYPGCVVGTYTPDEVEDFKPVVKDMGPADVVDRSTGEVIQPVKPIPPMALTDFNFTPTPFPLMVPYQDEPYNYFDSPEEWITGYARMVQKVFLSTKITAEEKQEKLKALAEVNSEVSSKFNSFQKTKLRAAIVQNGGTTNPKPETSLPSVNSEASDSESLSI